MTEKTGFSLEERVLCSDGGCIGTVGSNGCCRECGKPYEGDEDLPGALDFSPDFGKLGYAVNDDGDDAAPDPAEDDEADDTSERQCCADDTCIGIIGPDGQCGTCGKRS